jgi:lantibiotic biosynthesis protein
VDLYQHLDWILVRAPALPFSVIDDTQTPVEFWRSTPVAQRALAVATPSLVAALEREGDTNLKTNQKLGRYLRRMATRPTPYGLFAGVGIGHWSETTTLRLGDGPLHGHTRPGMDLVSTIVADLETRPDIARQLRVFANPANIERAGRLFVWGTAGEEGGEYSVRNTAAVSVTLKLARSPIEFKLLASDIAIRFPTISLERVSNFLLELVRLKILLTDLQPSFTGSEQAQYVLDRLKDLLGAEDYYRRLRSLLLKCREFDERSDAPGACFTGLLEEARELAPKVTGVPIQVDAVLSLKSSGLSRKVGREVTRVAELLLRLTPFPDGLRWISKLRNSFIGRYGIHRTVPLVQFVAEIGLEQHLLERTGESSPRDAELIKLAAECMHRRTRSIELDKSLLGRLETWTPNQARAPVSIEIAVSICGTSPAAIDSGDFNLVVAPIMGARQAGRMLGRFANILGPDALKYLEELAQFEQSRFDDAPLFAEISYDPPRLRSANVITRPSVRDYEIAINAAPGVPAERVIRLDELLVGIRDAKLALFWSKEGRRVIPCVGHMLNTRGSAPIVRFLSELAFDGLPVLSRFDWGLAESFPMLPRVTSGQSILRPAQWSVPAGRLRTPEEVASWRHDWDLPANVYLSKEDNWLLVDMDDPEQVTDLIIEAKKKPSEFLTFHEVMPGAQGAWLPSDNGSHLVEFVVPLIRSWCPPQKRKGTRIKVVPTSEGLKGLGSEWLFVSLYAPLAVHPSIIRGPLSDLARRCNTERLASSWFFVRYADPEPHIRLRFRGLPAELLGSLLPKVCEWAGELVSQRMCWRYAFETYEREIERYGGPGGLEIVEDIFAADSAAVAELLVRLAKENPAPDLKEIAVLTLDNLLESFGLGERARTEFFNRKATDDASLGREYRPRKTTLRRLLGTPASKSKYNIDRPDLRDAGGRLLQAEKTVLTANSLDDIHGHLVHMHCNRLLGPDLGLERLVLALCARTRRSLANHPEPSEG